MTVKVNYRTDSRIQNCYLKKKKKNPYKQRESFFSQVKLQQFDKKIGNQVPIVLWSGTATAFLVMLTIPSIVS